MNRKRSILRAGAVLAIALGAGHLAQTLQAERQAGTAEAPAAPTKVEQVSAGPDRPPASPDLPDPALPAAAALTAPETPPDPPGATVDLAALTGLPPALPPLVKLPPLPSLAPPAAAPDCTPQLSLSAAPQAMLTVTVQAPCAAGQRVVLRHAGLAIAQRLDAKGALTLDLPALDSAGAVTLRFPDASTIDAALALPEAATIRRFALQWMAGDALQLRVVEGGQDYGDPANLSAEAPVSAQGGSLVALGDPTLPDALLAQVYTWPADKGLAADPVIEATVTAANCGSEVLADALLARDGKITVTELSVAMPDCSALGDILVLNNLSGDVTLTAQN